MYSGAHRHYSWVTGRKRTPPDLFSDTGPLLDPISEDTKVSGVGHDIGVFEDFYYETSLEKVRLGLGAQFSLAVSLLFSRRVCLL